MVDYMVSLMPLIWAVNAVERIGKLGKHLYTILEFVPDYNIDKKYFDIVLGLVILGNYLLCYLLAEYIIVGC